MKKPSSIDEYMDFLGKGSTIIEKNDLAKSSSENIDDTSTTQSCDVLYVTALEDELEQLLNVYSVESDYVSKDGMKYIQHCEKIKDSKSLNIVFLKPRGKGLVPTAAITTEAILEFKPRLVMMTGICATPKGKANLGDVLLFRSIYLHDEGKITPKERKPNIDPIRISNKVDHICEQLLENKDLAYQIARRWPDNYTRREPLSIQKGIAASGSSVVADRNYIDEIVSHNRELIAIDMEAYAIAYCVEYVRNGCDWLVIKSVQDNGDESKDGADKDKYRSYAAFTSAMCSRKFVEEYFGACFAE